MIGQYILTGLVLVISAYTDIRYRKIYRSVIVIHLIAALVLHLVMQDCEAWAALMGLVPGLGFLLLAVITHESVGLGDGFLMLSCGFSLGTWKWLAVLFTSFVCVGLWALYLICFRGGKRKTAIPYVPFLLMGAVIQGIIQVIQGIM
ncbi:MAG: prepilin peptidase [Lachnospiraceae bacterium]|nr:prepilin peptidase [Lachnospiraceae bacterium]